MNRTNSHSKGSYTVKNEYFVVYCWSRTTKSYFPPHFTAFWYKDLYQAILQTIGATILNSLVDPGRPIRSHHRLTPPTTPSQSHSWLRTLMNQTVHICRLKTTTWHFWAHDKKNTKPFIIIKRTSDPDCFVCKWPGNGTVCIVRLKRCTAK